MRASTAPTGTGRPTKTRRQRPRRAERAWLLAPFDPLVWDRRRFEHFWDWAYRFEAYTPAPKRKLGHYALPLLWRERVVGWATVQVEGGTMRPAVGFVGSRIIEPAFVRAVDAELHRMHAFLGLAPFTASAADVDLARADGAASGATRAADEPAVRA